MKKSASALALYLVDTVRVTVVRRMRTTSGGLGRTRQGGGRKSFRVCVSTCFGLQQQSSGEVRGPQKGTRRDTSSAVLRKFRLFCLFIHLSQARGTHPVSPESRLNTTIHSGSSWGVPAGATTSSPTRNAMAPSALGV